MKLKAKIVYVHFIQLMCNILNQEMFLSFVDKVDDSVTMCNLSYT